MTVVLVIHTDTPLTLQCPLTLKLQSSKQLYSNIEYGDWYTGR